MPEDAVLKNCLQMLRVRGYAIESARESGRDSISLVVPYVDAKEQRGSVLFIDTERLNVGTVRECLGEAVDERATTAVIVHPGNPTASGKRPSGCSRAQRSSDRRLLPAAFFRNCILDHELVPVHERYPKPETVRRRYGSGLPVLLATDPVSQYHDFRAGEIVRVTRVNGSVAFRIVR